MVVFFLTVEEQFALQLQRRHRRGDPSGIDAVPREGGAEQGGETGEGIRGRGRAHLGSVDAGTGGGGGLARERRPDGTVASTGARREEEATVLRLWGSLVPAEVARWKREPRGFHSCEERAPTTSMATAPLPPRRYHGRVLRFIRVRDSEHEQRKRQEVGGEEEGSRGFPGASLAPRCDEEGGRPPGFPFPRTAQFPGGQGGETATRPEGVASV